MRMSSKTSSQVVPPMAVDAHKSCDETLGGARMRCLLLLLMMSFAALSLAQESGFDMRSGVTMLKETFDEDTQTAFAKQLLAHRHVTLAKGAGPDGSNAIRVAYVGFEQGSEGVVLRFPLDVTAESATLSYDVYFDKDFQWVLGGKLHGLGPKRPATGGRRGKPDQWSARIMWRRDGRCQTYLYDQDDTKKWGVGKTTRQRVFSAGQWHSVVYQVSLNTPGKSNGFVRVCVDGQEVINQKGVVFRGTGGDDTKIQMFLFSTFHGGNNQRWAPVDAKGNYTTVYAYFDNIMITEGIQPILSDDVLKTTPEK